MVTSDNFQALIYELKELLVEEGIGFTLQELKQKLPAASRRFNETLQMEMRLKDVNTRKRQGLISTEGLNVEYNQIRLDLMEFLDSLTLADFSTEQATEKSDKKSKQGSILYRIPTTMQLHKETRCIVRLAFDEEYLLENIELNNDTHIQSIRIAEVMGVELLDPAEDPAFAIRTMTEHEQFLDEDDYTEWVFKVKPLREGVFPLVLKVTVVEEIRGKERKRNIVLEENVQITTSRPVSDDAFQRATVPSIEAQQASPPTSGIVQAARRYAGVLALLLIATVGTFAFDLPQEARWQLAKIENTEQSFDAYLERYPEGRHAQDARWRQAEISNTEGAYMAYLDEYPDGKFRVEASNRAEKLAFDQAIETADSSNLSPLKAFLQKYKNGRLEKKAQKILEQAAADSLAYQKALTLNTAEAFENYVKKFPKGQYLELARKQIKDLTAPATPTVTNQPKAPVVRNANVVVPKMVAVSSGTFTMGNDDGAGNEKPAHQVTLAAFEIGRYEVTNAEFVAFLNAKGNQTEGGNTWLLFDSDTKIEQKDGVFRVVAGFENYPVVNVSWFGAKSYCMWLTEQTGRKFRLPTEAEWEYAAKGGGSNRSTGTALYAGSSNLDEVAWYLKNSKYSLHPVGQKKANGLGLFDMSGNVREWCWDWLDNSYYKVSPAESPQGPGTGRSRVVRGGAWTTIPSACEVSNRNAYNPIYRNSSIGFRVVRQ